MTIIRSFLCFLSALALLTSAFALNNADVIKMTNAGLGADIIISAVKGSPNNSFDTTADGLIALKTAKVADAVFAAILTSWAAPVTSATKTAEPNVPTTVVTVTALRRGLYFVKDGGKPERAKNITASDVKRPFATVNVNYKIKAFFAGASASQVLKAGDMIVISGWDLEPQVAKFHLEGGRRLSLLTKSGRIVPEDLVSLSWQRDENDNWVATIPAGFAAGEYWVLIPNDETPAADFAIR